MTTPKTRRRTLRTQLACCSALVLDVNEADLLAVEVSTRRLLDRLYELTGQDNPPMPTPLVRRPTRR